MWNWTVCYRLYKPVWINSVRSRPRTRLTNIHICFVMNVSIYLCYCIYNRGLNHDELPGNAKTINWSKLWACLEEEINRN